MRYYLARLPSAPVLLLLGALNLAGACKPAGELTIIFDSNLNTEGLEVVMVPVDPAPLLRGALPRATAAQADSLARLATFEDSAATLDRHFQNLRDELNSAASTLTRADRRSDEYAERYDEFQSRAQRADSLRIARDRLLARAAAHRAALEHLLPDSARIREDARQVHKKLSAARDGTRAARSVPARSGPLVVNVEPGKWWVGLARGGMAPSSFHSVSVERDAQDTVRLRTSR
jgi:hypothetical protein